VLLEDLVDELDAYFRIGLVSCDDWARAFEHAYPREPSWREHVEPAFAGHWAGLMVRGDAEVERVVTCVFPGDAVIAGLEPRTLLFSEHPLDFTDGGGFRPLARSSFATLAERGCSLYVVHAPLYQHPEVGPSRLLADGLGLEQAETYHPIDPGLPGGIAVVGESSLTVEGLADRIRGFLGPCIPVHVLTRTAERAGTVAVVAGGGARVEILQASLERGCQTYVTGNAATNSGVARVQDRVRAFRRLADAEHISLIDATHYGTERPPQLAMVDWFRRLGLPARFVENGPR
jgi:putative NIF3 family GTP cyclohydrolase 1 type 2